MSQVKIWVSPRALKHDLFLSCSRPTRSRDSCIVRWPHSLDLNSAHIYPTPRFFRLIAITEDCQDGSNRRPPAGEYDNPSTAEIELHLFELAIRFFPDIQALNTIPGPPTTALSRYSRIHDRALSFPLVTVEGSLPHWLAPRNPAYDQGWGFQGCAPRGTEFFTASQRDLCPHRNRTEIDVCGTDATSLSLCHVNPCRDSLALVVRFCRMLLIW